MTTRDPFNLLRRDSALSILHSTPRAPLSPSSASSDAAPSDADMSFSVPKNVPSFQHPQRSLEDHAWGASPGPKQRAGITNGVGDKIKGYFDNRDVLPSYKDKPYYAASSRPGPLWRRKRSLAGAVLLFVGFLYWLGVFSRRYETPVKPARPKSSWGWPKKEPEVADWNARRERVKEAFTLSWDAYDQHAWGMRRPDPAPGIADYPGYDEYHPVSKTGRQMVPKGLGWIIVDSLDTLMIMNLTSRLSHARDWVSTALNYDQDQEVNTFETTIRMLGGLLSAHYLSTTFPDLAPLGGVAGSEADQDVYLEKASDLADRLLGAYDSQSGVPFASVNLQSRKGVPSHADGGASSTAEAATLQLEMKYLAKLTGEKTYWDRAEHVMKAIDDNGVEDGLVPIFIYADSGTFRGSNIRLGSRGDSYYGTRAKGDAGQADVSEYLIKQYLQTSKQEPVYLELWDQALAGVRKHLITYSKETNLTILGELPDGIGKALSPKMDHLVCFMPGTIALGATGGRTEEEARKSGNWGPKQEKEMKLARELTQTCWGMYKVTRTGLAPEIAHFEIHDPPLMESDHVKPLDGLADDEDADWRSDFIIKSNDAHNLQRPETVESLFYMWRITKDERYRRWGWAMFKAFVEHTNVGGGSGFTSLDNVNAIPAPHRDNMESFWLVGH